MLSNGCGSSTEGISRGDYPPGISHARTDGKMFNPARLRAKANLHRVLIREMLFAGDAAITTHNVEDLHQLMDRLSHAC